jgi:hypothetical protein
LLARKVEPGMTVRVRSRNREFSFEVEETSQPARAEETLPAVTT